MGTGELLVATGAEGEGVIVIVIVFEVTGFTVLQGAFEVTIQVTILPLVRVDVVKKCEFVPSFTPLTFH